MNLESYTPDAICQAMHLGQFIDPRWLTAPATVLRIVLKPSFHPELCLTFEQSGNATFLSTVALAEQLWAHPGEIHRTRFVNEVELPADAFTELSALFEAALAASPPEGRYACLDGMSAESCLVTSGLTKQMTGSVTFTPEYACFVRRVVEMAWTDCHTPRVRNALADAGVYLGLKYPRQDIPAEKPAATVAVLGTIEDKHNFLNTLSQVKRSRKS